MPVISKKINHLRLIPHTTAELIELDAAGRIWKKRDVVLNTDTGEMRRGIGTSTWSQLAPKGAEVHLTVVTIATSDVDVSQINNGDTIASAAVATGDAIALINQTDPADNGIYTVGATAGTTVRHADYASYDSHVGLVIAASAGVNTAKYYRCTSAAGGTLDTTAITFTRVGTGKLDLSATGPHAGIQQATPALGDKIFFFDVSDGDALKWCTLTQAQTLINT